MHVRRRRLATSILACTTIGLLAWSPAFAGIPIQSGSDPDQPSVALGTSVWTDGPRFVPASSKSARQFLWSATQDDVELPSTVTCGSGVVKTTGDWIVEGVHTLRCKFHDAGKTKVGVRATEGGSTIDGRKHVRATNRVVSVADGQLVIDGPAGDDQLGGALATPDLNGDGKADIVIGGTSTSYGPGNDAGYVEVVFGRAKAGTVDIDTLPASKGFRIDGAGIDGFGRSLASAGDINGDGLDDLLIGANGGSGGDGVVYVVFGSHSTADVDLGSLTPDRGALIMGPDMADARGTTLAGIGDANGDGRDDIVIGTPGFDGGDGRVDLLFGGTSFGDVDLAALPGDRGIHIDGPGASTGTAVAGGDINGDGLADVIIGARLAVHSNVVVVYGSESPVDVDASSLSVAEGFQIGGDEEESLGVQAVAAGDMDGDGYDEVALSHPTWSDSSNWAISIVRGAKTNASIPDVASPPARLIKVFSPDDELGLDMTTLDWNGDGRADLLVGGAYADDNGEGSGSAYLVKGRTTLHDLDLNAYDSRWFRIDGDNVFAFAGDAVAAGDVTGDGKVDLLVGAPGQVGWSDDSTPGRVGVFRGTRTDTSKPSVSAPKTSIRAGAAPDGGDPIVRVRWHGSDTGSGIDHYVVSQSTAGGPWVKVASTAATHLDLPLATGTRYRFRVRAYDRVGNRSGWQVGDNIRLSQRHDSSSLIAYTGLWQVDADPAYVGGTTHFGSDPGARARLTFTGRQIALVAPTGPTSGRAKVYVNGKLAGSVKLYSASDQASHVVARWSWSQPASRTISIRVIGTPGHPRVDIDAFYIIR